MLPGRNTDPDHLGMLIERERVTVTAAVTTVWARFIEKVEAGTYDLSSLKRILIGGMSIAELARRAIRRARDRDPPRLGHDRDVADGHDVEAEHED